MATKKKTAKKTVTKKAPKASPKKTAKKAAPQKAAKKKDSSKDRADAKSLGLGLIHFRVLMALAKSGRAMTYRNIEKATGYYSMLAGIMRTDPENSLIARKLAKVAPPDNDGAGNVAFSITANGIKLLKKLSQK